MHSIFLVFSELNHWGLDWTVREIWEREKHSVLCINFGTTRYFITKQKYEFMPYACLDRNILKRKPEPLSYKHMLRHHIRPGSDSKALNVKTFNISSHFTLKLQFISGCQSVKSFFDQKKKVTCHSDVTCVIRINHQLSWHNKTQPMGTQLLLWSSLL